MGWSGVAGVGGDGGVPGGPMSSAGLSSLPVWPSRVASFCASLVDGRAGVSQFFLEEDLDSLEEEAVGLLWFDLWFPPPPDL